MSLAIVDHEVPFSAMDASSSAPSSAAAAFKQRNDMSSERNSLIDVYRSIVSASSVASSDISCGPIFSFVEQILASNQPWKPSEPEQVIKETRKGGGEGVAREEFQGVGQMGR